MKKVVIYIGIIAATVVTFTLCAWAIDALFPHLHEYSFRAGGENHFSQMERVYATERQIA